MFANYYTSDLLSLTPQEQSPNKQRRLFSGNTTNREAYIKDINQQLEAKNVHNRVSTLLSEVETGYLMIAHKIEYNNLDDNITKVMLHTEKTFISNSRINWTKTLSKIVHGKLYYKLLLGYFGGKCISQCALYSVATKIYIDRNPLHLDETRALLKQEWKIHTKYLEEAAEHRDKSLEYFIKSGDKDTESMNL